MSCFVVYVLYYIISLHFETLCHAILYAMFLYFKGILYCIHSLLHVISLFYSIPNHIILSRIILSIIRIILSKAAEWLGKRLGKGLGKWLGDGPGTWFNIVSYRIVSYHIVWLGDGLGKWLGAELGKWLRYIRVTISHRIILSRITQHTPLCTCLLCRFTRFSFYLYQHITILHSRIAIHHILFHRNTACTTSRPPMAEGKAVTSLLHA